ncbi:MAG: polysaccharide deacetylase family protein [Planctomycetota bacterium]|jgi:hypothetical protein
MEPELRQRCIDYSLEVLFGSKELTSEFKHLIHYGLPEDAVGRDCSLCIVPSGFFGEVYGKTESMPKLPLEEIEDTPLLYGRPEIRREGECLIVYADIIASSYFLVTRYEEMVRREVRDAHGRFPGKESLAYRCGFINRPIVDEYSTLLRKWLQEAGVEIPEPKRKFSVLLTHDVDAIRKYSKPIKTILYSLAGKQPLSNIIECLQVKTGFRQDPYYSFDEMIELDKGLVESSTELSVETIYYFMGGNRHRLDSKYKINSERLKEIIQKVRDSGATIGLHTSYYASFEPDSIIQHKENLEEACGSNIKDNRFHYLSWREIEDGWGLVKAGIKRDSSLGYADMAGFRLGVCRPIPLFDPIKMKPFDIEEHPLIIMDRTLFSPKYMDLDEKEFFHYCQNIIKQIRKHKGEFVILWHSTIFANNRETNYSTVYRKILNDIFDE